MPRPMEWRPTNRRPTTSRPDPVRGGRERPASVDAAASSLPDDASLEDLATRVDDGTVTGADVRAARGR